MAPLFASGLASFTFDMPPPNMTAITSDMASFIFDMVSSILNATLQLNTYCVAEFFANTTFKETSSPTYINLPSCLIHGGRAKHFSNLATVAIMSGSILALMAILYCCYTVSTTLERFVSATFQRNLQGSLRSLAIGENLDMMHPTLTPSKLEENRATRLQMGEPLPSIQVLPTACQIEGLLMREWGTLLPPPYLAYLT